MIVVEFVRAIDNVNSSRLFEFSKPFALFSTLVVVSLHSF